MELVVALQVFPSPARPRPHGSVRCVFSVWHDIIPLPPENQARIWARVGVIITAALQDENFEVDARVCRERTLLLLDYYKKQDVASLRRFGTERLYAQKEDLLHEVLELEAEKRLLANWENIKYQQKPEDDHEGMAELSAAPMAKRPCRCCCQTYSEILSFLEKRSEAEQWLREEELALRREELQIQRSTIC